jgi:hypothetical protein
MYHEIFVRNRPPQEKLPGLGGLTIEETAERQDAARKADNCGKETREGRKGDRA